jgi:hypothetical protein
MQDNFQGFKYREPEKYSCNMIPCRERFNPATHNKKDLICILVIKQQ